MEPSFTDDAAALAGHASALADAVEATLPGWVEASVERCLTDAGAQVSPEVAAAATAAGQRAVEEVGPAVRHLLSLDIDDQRDTPLGLLREAVRYPTEVLRRAGVRPVERDEFSRRSFPEDDYDLTPASFGDLAPALAEAGLVWGAAKAHVHLARRREADGT